MKDWLHWATLHHFPRLYFWTWAKRDYFWLQLMADPAGDPVPIYDQLHAAPPLTGDCLVQGLTGRVRGYLVGHYATATQVLHSPDFGVLPSRSEGLPTLMRWLEQATAPKALHPLLPPTMPAVDGPDHLRYRKAAQGWFTPHRIQDMTERIEEAATILLDELDADARIAGRWHRDLVQDFCWKLPATMIGNIYGLTFEQVKAADFFHEYDSALNVLDVNLPWGTYRRMSTALAQLYSWIRQQLHNGPADGLVQGLVRTGTLNDLEITVTSGLILEAGFATTVQLLANGLRLLIDHPEQVALLQDRPDFWPNAVEEVLRIESPLQFTARIAQRDTEVAGVPIKKGRVVVLALAAANHDPAVFPDPHRFDVTRWNAKSHLAFSAGRHYCIGPALARAEAKIAFPMFFERFPHAQLRGPLKREPTQVMRTWQSLPVKLGHTPNPRARRLNMTVDDLTKHQIADYYDQTTAHHYLRFWCDPTALGLHGGFYDDTHRTHGQAQEHMWEVVADLAPVKPKDRVLDAGCGVGGGSIWLAEHRQAHVVGVTVSPKQVQIANRYAERRGVSHRVHVVCGDYTNTGFEDESFDVVYAVESVCYTPHKFDFFHEAFRVLKPGGHLVMVDGMRAHRPLPGGGEEYVKKLLKSWACEDVGTIDEHVLRARLAGFTDVQTRDITAYLFRDSRRMFRLGLATWPLAALMRALRVTTAVQYGNTVSAIQQYRAYKRSWIREFTLSARKPN